MGGMGGGMPGMDMLGGGAAGLSGGIGAAPPGGQLNAILGGGNTPYAHGYGMGTTGPFEGYQSGPGIQNPQGFAAEGGDLTQRGIGENMFDALGGGFMRPGMSEGFAAKSLGEFKDGTPDGTDRQGANFDRFNASRPGIADEPGFEAYYDRAAERLGRDMNNQLSARGVYGSSVGVGQLGDAMTDLRADQAKNEADYNLRRLGEERGWEGLAGSLAGGADRNSLDRSQNQLGWMSGLGNIAQAGDNFGLNRLNSGLSGANNAQALEQGRFQTLLGNELGMGDRMNGMMGQAYGDMLQTDMDLMNSSMGMGMGLAAEALNQDYRTQEKIKDDESHAMDMFGGLMGGMMGGL